MQDAIWAKLADPNPIRKIKRSIRNVNEQKHINNLHVIFRSAQAHNGCDDVGTELRPPVKAVVKGDVGGGPEKRKRGLPNAFMLLV